MPPPTPPTIRFLLSWKKILHNNNNNNNNNNRKEFQNTLAIKLGHGSVGSKRWEHIKNITMKNGSSSVVDKDYRMGLISIEIVVIAIVFLWLILLGLFFINVYITNLEKNHFCLLEK